jgi:hypothetical protein
MIYLLLIYLVSKSPLMDLQTVGLQVTGQGDRPMLVSPHLQVQP